MALHQRIDAGSVLVRQALGITLATAILSAAPLMAQKPVPTPGPPPRQPEAKAAPGEQKAPEITAADVGAFLDGIIPLQLQREDIAGAVISVVKDGKVLFRKGYGYDDEKRKTPVSVDTTLFRPGSISKLFTWTSIMQLEEQGKLDLDRDVNDYLDFKVPAAFAKPLTLRNIMTHTPGFEESLKDLFVRNASDLTPLGAYLPSHLPRQIFPPGTVPAYSNYAVGMAGYIVERVSGRAFNDYVTEFIFEPLGMSHSTFVQPLPDLLKPLMSKGYLQASQDAKSFEFVEPAPAGALATTGGDISRFMIAHLQDGRVGDQQILRPETARLMHSRQFGLDPSMNGMALGFYEESRNGHRIIGHGGDTVYFHSDLHLVLDAGLGFFISYNSAGKGENSPRSAVWEKFLDRYFPYTPPAGQQIANPGRDMRSVAGLYLPSRRSQGNIADLFFALGQLKVYPNKDGTISVDPLRDLNGQLTRWREIAPMTYRDVNGQNRIVFQPLSDGRLRLVIWFPAIEFERVGWAGSKTVNQFVAGSSLGIFALALIFWPAGAAVRWHYGRKLELPPGERRVRVWVRLFAALSLVLCGVFAALVSKANVPGFFSRWLDPWLYLLEAGNGLCMLGVVPALYSAILAWRNHERWLWSRIGEAMLAVAFVEFAWFLVHWNLINFELHY